MSEGSFQDRLRDHAKAFDGLLSLIPAKMYYGEDNTDQWMKKKQTKAEAKAARKNKLDPDSELNRNAKEIMDERAKNKRKIRELEQDDAADDDEDDEFEPVEGVEAERPGEGLKKQKPENNKKKQKVDEEGAEDEAENGEGANATPAQKLSKKAEKKEKRKQKKAEKKAQEGAEESKSVAPTETPNSQKQSAVPKSKGKMLKEQQAEEDETKADSDEEMGDIEPEVADFSGLQDDASESAASERQDESPIFDSNGPKGASTEPASTSTSLSSAVPPSEKPKHIKIPSDTSALKARLAAKIEALRAARKADGPDGKPIRTRQELIESRRVNQAQRKAHKKELRLKAKAEEELKREQALASNSPSVMSPSVELDEATGNFAFGRMAFGDGSQLSHDLSYVLTSGKRKGPSDPKTALLKVQNQKKRLQELDAEKQQDIAEKEAWLTARRRVEGEKIRDDEAILKKAVKRKETAKKKSEKAWKERAHGVQQAQKERQKKREENIRKRREDKMLGKAGKKKKASAGAKKKSRPGFEGSLGVGRK